MSKLFFEKVNELFPGVMDRMIGYADIEIEKIGRLYGINFPDDFKSFMQIAGRCDGGLIGDDPLIIYRPSWSVRTHILFQVNFFNSLQEIGAWDYLNKPFVASLESESQYYFLQTNVENPDLVYHFDENNESVASTGMSFGEYLVDILKRYPVGGVVCKGELINI